MHKYKPESADYSIEEVRSACLKAAAWRESGREGGAKAFGAAGISSYAKRSIFAIDVTVQRVLLWLS
jgi:hypothetical protein